MKLDYLPTNGICLACTKGGDDARDTGKERTTAYRQFSGEKFDANSGDHRDSEEHKPLLDSAGRPTVLIAWFTAVVPA